MSQFKSIDDGIFIGPQPTDADLKTAREQRIATVIDLRLPNETAASNRELTERHGLSYRNIPVDKEQLQEGQIGELDAAITASDGPVLLHCATGARAALLLGLAKARKQQWSSAQVFDWARGAGWDIESQPAFAGFVRETLTKKPHA